MEEFVLPAHFEDLCLSYSDGRYVVQPTKGGGLPNLLDGIAYLLADDVCAIVSHSTFDPLYHAVKGVMDMETEVLCSMLRLLSQSLSRLLSDVQRRVQARDVDPESERSQQAVHEARNALKMYCFLLISTLQRTDKMNKKDDREKKSKKKASELSEWSAAEEVTVASLLDVLEHNCALQLWSDEPEPEFSAMFLRLALQLMRDPLLARNKALRSCTLGLCSRAIERFSLESTASFELLSLAQSSEAAALLVASLLSHMASLPPLSALSSSSPGSSSSSLVQALLYDVSRLDGRQLVRDVAASKCIATLLAELSELLPSAALSSMALLLPHLNSEAYTIRNGLVRSLTALLAAKDVSGLDNKTRDALLQVLLDRAIDVTSYTRSTLLQCWTRLAEQQRIPLRFLLRVLQMAAERLVDRSVHVRRQSVRLCISLLQHNPFGAQLNEKLFAAKTETLKQRLHTLESSGEPGEQDRDEEQDDEGKSGTKNQEVEAMQHELAFYSAATAMSQELGALMPPLVHLLSSKFASDALVAIELCVVARSFQVDGSLEALDRMLPLVFCKHEEVVDAVCNAYHSLYIDSVPPKEGIESFVRLAIRSSMAEHSCLQVIIHRLVDKKQIGKSHINALLLILNEKTAPGGARVRGAVDVLQMCALSNASLISKNVPLLLRLGFGQQEGAQTEAEPLLIRSVCVALQRLRNADLIAYEDVESVKRRAAVSADVVGEIRGKLLLLLSGKLGSGPNWFAAAEQALNSLFLLDLGAPDVCAELLHAWANRLFAAAPTTDDGRDSSSSGTDRVEEGGESGGSAEALSEAPDAAVHCSASELSQFFFLVGHISIRMLVYTEKLESAWKRLRQAQKDERAAPSGSLDSCEEIASPDGPVEGGAIEESLEEMQTAAASEEYEMEMLRDRAQLSLVSHHNLLGALAPIIVAVVGNPKHYPHDMLQVSANLALCKLMCVNTEFCERNLQLLFTILERSQSALIRANSIIALGDMAFRFPNVLVPWTGQMYAPLKDSDTSVRKNALMVLSHLILNDMIKVKGEISSVVLCLEDSEESIVELAKLFFTELSRKANNPIYNVLPDTISRLLHVEHVQEASFRRVSKFLLDFIDKERQIESLVEKLCHRFQATQEAQHWRGIAHCISCLKFSSDKSVRKLMSMIGAYKHALVEDDVFNCMSAVISKTKKNATAEMCDLIAEFEKRITAYHEHRDPDDPEQQHQQQQQPQPQPQQRRKRKSRVAKHDESSEDEDEEDQEEAYDEEGNENEDTGGEDDD